MIDKSIRLVKNCINFFRRIPLNFRALYVLCFRLQSEYNSANKSANQYNNDIERLKSIVEDKERAALQLRHQLDSKTELLKTANKQMADTSSENKHLKSLNKVSNFTSSVLSRLSTTRVVVIGGCF